MLAFRDLDKDRPSDMYSMLHSPQCKTRFNAVSMARHHFHWAATSRHHNAI